MSARAAVVCLLLFCCLARPALGQERVLFISSYHPGFPTFFQQIEGLKSVIDPAGCVMDVEFMDSKRFAGPEDLRLFHDMLRAKLGQLPPYQVVVTSDDNALDFALRYRAELFPQAPVVFCGVNNLEKARSLNGSEWFTGIIEAVSMRETVDLVFALHPTVRTLYAVVDGTSSGQGDMVTFRRQHAPVPGGALGVLSLADLTWDELARRIGTLTDRDALLLLSAYRDAAGVGKTFEGGLAWILDHTSAPVYHLWEHGLGRGIVGGKVISHFSQGQLAGRMVLDVLGGRPVRDIPVMEGNEANRYIFDNDALRRFGVPLGALPENSKVINKPYSLWEEYQGLILALLAVAAVLLTLVCLLALYVLRLRKVRMRLRQSEERLQMALEATSDGLWDWQLDDGGVYFSPGYLAMVGYGPEELPHSVETWRSLLHPDDWPATERVVFEHMNNGREFAAEFRLRSRDGVWKWILCRGKTIAWTKSGRPKRMVGTHTDITERKQFEARLVQAKEAAETANRVKDEFIANISHEVRTPLNGVMGMLQLLESAGLNEEQAAFADTALQSSRSLLRVLNDLLDFSKIQAGKLDIHEAPFDLGVLVEESLNLFKIPAQEKGIELVADIDPRAVRTYAGDAGRIRQILFNLVGNAVKFTPSGFISVEVYSLWHPAPGRERLVFAVQDSGIGISEADLSLIFAPFSQVDGSLTRAFQGTGLGLPIVKKLVEMMGGHCCVESVPGQGTTIRFFVTVGAHDPLPAAEKRTVPSASVRPLDLLLVEDERVNRLMASRMLENLGHAVAVAENGLACLDLLRKRRFDAVLMDIQMPVVDGLEATRAIRTVPEFTAVSRIPIIGLSAHAAHHDRQRALDAGMNEYLVKPLERADIEAVLCQVADGRYAA